jgi:hypothetical protein
MCCLQTPATHTWLAEHAVLQLPQWVSSVCRFTHAVRPVSEFTVHAVNPASQVVLQPPDWQWLLPLSRLGQPLPQLPQLLGSLCVLVQPFPQLVSPGWQTLTHALFTQSLPDPHCVPQPPQNCGSVLVSTHALPPLTGAHLVAVDALQVTSHALEVHAGAPVPAPETGAAQTLVQLPQWFGSVFSSKQPSGAHLSGKLALAHM